MVTITLSESDARQLSRMMLAGYTGSLGESVLAQVRAQLPPLAVRCPHAHQHSGPYFTTEAELRTHLEEAHHYSADEEDEESAAYYAEKLFSERV